MECASRSQKVCPHLALKPRAHDCCIVRSQKLSQCLRNYRATLSLPRIPDSKEHKSWIANTLRALADKAKGAIKEGAGKFSGDKDMETEGKLDKAKGSAHNAAGDVKDAARDAADAIKK